MTYLKFVAVFLVFTLSACGQSGHGTQPKISDARQYYPSYVILGIFCGECSIHCTTMYRYNVVGNSATLFVDSTDSYFKNNGKVVCNTKINDIKKLHAVNKLVQRIPQTFLKTNKIEQTFGCPDCTDGCGIYFEFGKNAAVKKFYIDYATDKLDKGVRDFGEFIKVTLTQLNRKD